MPVRAKFKVDGFSSLLLQRQIDPRGNWETGNVEMVEMRTVSLSPVYANGDPDHENSKFWRASPSGKIELGTVNPEAWKHFELGAEYYIDFTKAE